MHDTLLGRSGQDRAGRVVLLLACAKSRHVRHTSKQTLVRMFGAEVDSSRTIIKYCERYRLVDFTAAHGRERLTVTSRPRPLPQRLDCIEPLISAHQWRPP